MRAIRKRKRQNCKRPRPDDADMSDDDESEEGPQERKFRRIIFQSNIDQLKTLLKQAESEPWNHLQGEDSDD